MGFGSMAAIYVGVPFTVHVISTVDCRSRKLEKRHVFLVAKIYPETLFSFNLVFCVSSGSSMNVFVWFCLFSIKTEIQFAMESISFQFFLFFLTTDRRHTCETRMHKSLNRKALKNIHNFRHGTGVCVCSARCTTKINTNKNGTEQCFSAF